MYHCKDSLSGINGEIRPGIVHRIDMDTTGSLIVCKNDNSHVNIAEQIKIHSVNRIYEGIVFGNVKEDEGTIEGPIGRHPIERKKMAINEKNGKLAITHYKVLERFGNYTYMQFKLETGRTHLIRVHMSSIVIHFWVMLYIQVEKVHLKTFADRPCTQKRLVSFIHLHMNIWNFMHHCQNILKNYCHS